MAETEDKILVQVDGRGKMMDPEEVRKLCFQNVNGACHASFSKGELPCISGGDYCAATINTSVHKEDKPLEIINL